MKHIFIARHGDYGIDHRINDIGRAQMEILGRTIKEILRGGSAYLISSTAPRALDSSGVLKAELALSDLDYIPYLWSGEDGPYDNYCKDNNNEKLMQFVNERKKADGLIMMTHIDITDRFPDYFLMKEFGQDKRIEGITKGRAVHFDIEKRIYRIIPR
jgi:hypothetical protein